MYKSIGLVAALVVCANFVSIVSAIVGPGPAYSIVVTNNDGLYSRQLNVWEAGDRECVCLETTQTNTIRGINGGTIRLFWSADCTGNYNTLGSNSVVSKAQWVNSVSFGQGGVASWGPGSDCPNLYA